MKHGAQDRSFITKRLGKRYDYFISIIVWGLIWWIVIPQGNVFIPSLKEVAIEFVSFLKNGDLLKDVIASFTRVIIGVFIATFLGLTLAILSKLSNLFLVLSDGLLEVIRPVPPIAWIPVAIVWFGVGEAPAIAIVTLGAFFPIWLGAQQGLNAIQKQHTWAAKSFGASSILLLTDVMIPSSLPYVLHGLRLGVGFGWFCLVAAEMMGAQSGLGYGIQLFSLNLEIPKLYCYILLIGIIGMLMNYFMRILEKRLTFWNQLLSEENE